VGLWYCPVGNWLARSSCQVGSYVLQIIGEKSVLACVMLVAACMYEGLCVCVSVYVLGICCAYYVHMLHCCCACGLHAQCGHVFGACCAYNEHVVCTCSVYCVHMLRVCCACVVQMHFRSWGNGCELRCTALQPVTQQQFDFHTFCIHVWATF